MKFQACTLEIHKEMHPNFLLVKNFVTGERDIAPSSFTISIITSFSRWYTETQTLLHYFVNFQKKLELFFFFVEKILISKLYYINEHKLIKTLSYKFRSLIFSIQLRTTSLSLSLSLSLYIYIYIFPGKHLTNLFWKAGCHAGSESS